MKAFFLALLACVALTLPQRANALCNPCDFTINTHTNWLGCPDTDKCGIDTTIWCDNCATFTLNMGPNACNVISIDIIPPPGLCCRACGVTDSPTHASWTSTQETCDAGNPTLTPPSGTTFGANANMIFKICAGTSGNTYTITLNTTGGPCTTTITI